MYAASTSRSHLWQCLRSSLPPFSRKNNVVFTSALVLVVAHARGADSADARPGKEHDADDRAVAQGDQVGSVYARQTVDWPIFCRVVTVVLI